MRRIEQGSHLRRAHGSSQREPLKRDSSARAPARLPPIRAENCGLCGSCAPARVLDHGNQAPDAVLGGTADVAPPVLEAGKSGGLVSSRESASAARRAPPHAPDLQDAHPVPGDWERWLGWERGPHVRCQSAVLENSCCTRTRHPLRGHVFTGCKGGHGRL